MQPNQKILAIMAVLSLFVITNCKDRFEIPDGIRKIFSTVPVGDMSECKLKGELVYVVGINAYDAGGSIYDKNGMRIASCNYAWGPVDSLCRQLKDCEVVYRVKDHITGQPPVDKYKLAKRGR